MAEPVFQLEQVSYAYPGGIPAMENLTIAFAAGECAAIIGANGTGKSTLLAMLDGLLFPERGTLRAFGERVDEARLEDAVHGPAFRRRVAYVFQNPEIQLFCPTVKEDILFGPLQLEMPKARVASRFEEVVALLRLEPLLSRSPHRLSLGEKKKVAIATVLVLDPEVLLLDEPTAGLDPQTVRDIIGVLAADRAAGRTVVFATHDLHLVAELADVVHVFGKGKGLVKTGSPDEILGDDAFLRAHNLIHTHVHRHGGHGHAHPH